MGFNFMKRDLASQEKASRTTAPNINERKDERVLGGSKQEPLKSTKSSLKQHDSSDALGNKRRNKSKDRSSSSTSIKQEDDEEPTKTKTIRKKSKEETRPKTDADDGGRKKSVTTLEDLMAQSSLPKIKPAADWKTPTTASPKASTKAMKRRNSLGAGFRNMDDQLQGKSRSEHVQRATIKTKKKIDRQSSDSELKKRKVKSKGLDVVPQSSEQTKTISLDDFLPEPTAGSNPWDAQTINTEPLSGCIDPNVRRALRSRRRTSILASSGIEGGSSLHSCRSTDSKNKRLTSRTSSRERRRTDSDRSEGIKYHRSTSSNCSMESSFASVASYGIDETLIDTFTDIHDNSVSLREKKLEARLQEEEERNDELARKVMEIEKKMSDLQTENELLSAKMRRTQLDSDRVLAEKNKEINELSDTVDRILEAERKMDAPRGNVTSNETRLENELMQAKTKLSTMEKCVSDMREQNAQLSAEISCLRNSSKPSALKMVDESMQKQNADLLEKLKFKDETIEHLMDQLKQFKQSKRSIDGSIHARVPEMDRSGHGLIGSLADTMSKFSPGSLARRKVETREDRMNSVKPFPQLQAL